MKYLKLLLLLLVVGIAACQPGANVVATTQEAAVRFDPSPPAQIKPGDSLHLQSSGSASSEPFILSDSFLVRVRWNMLEGNDFTLVVRPLQDQVEGVQFTIQKLPGEGSGDWIFPAGEYEVVISGEGSKWSVTIEFVDYMNPPDFGD